MTVSRKAGTAAIIAAAAALFCLAGAGMLYIKFGAFLPSFPEAFLGQLTLAAETRPIRADQYQSAQYVLGEIPAWQIVDAQYIGTGEELFFWEPPYAGFRRTRLTRQETEQMQDLFTKARMFQASSTGSGYECLRFNRIQKAHLEPCTEGVDWMDQFASIKGLSGELQRTGVLVVVVGNNRTNAASKLVEILLYRSDGGLAFEARQKSGPWWLMGVADPSALVDSLAGRMQAEPVPVLWERLEEDVVDRRAARVFGESYTKALEAVRSSPQALEIFGEPLSLRPARALNTYASWMDSTSITLTLAARGPKGEGAVLVRGFAPFEQFDLDFVSGGRLAARLD